MSITSYLVDRAIAGEQATTTTGAGTSTTIGVATTSVNGLMSSTDKAKLNDLSIESSEVNADLVSLYTIAKA